MNKTVLLLGCDGYIGNALTQRLLYNGFKVIGVDNLIRKFWVESHMNSVSAIPVMGIHEKIKRFNELGEFIFHCIDIIEGGKQIAALLEEHKPSTVVNLAYIPSAPFSQSSQENASFTLVNNIIGTNSLLWAIKNNSPDSHYVSLSALTSNKPNSIYDISKQTTTNITAFLSSLWGLRCTAVQQAITFGMYTDEIDDTKIYSRLDSDEAAGTVVNRFIVQTLLGVPMTIYGDGTHKRNFISLNDSIQILELAINNIPDAGKVMTLPQSSEYYSIVEVADIIEMVATKLGLPNARKYIPTPRNEYTDNKYCDNSVDKLKKLGYSTTRIIEKEATHTISALYGDVPEELRSVVMPSIKYN